jgi:Spy/CpxP family protein refolding chaperone
MAITRRWWNVAGALALTLGLATAAAAEPGRRGDGGPEGVKARVAKMKENLGLSDEQAQKIEAILDEARGQGRTERSQARQRRREVHEKIQAVLTEEQRAKAAELREGRRRSRP